MVYFFILQHARDFHKWEVSGKVHGMNNKSNAWEFYLILHIKVWSWYTLVALWEKLCIDRSTHPWPTLFTLINSDCIFWVCCRPLVFLGFECCSLCWSHGANSQEYCGSPGTREHACRGVQLGTGNEECTNSTFVLDSLSS